MTNAIRYSQTDLTTFEELAVELDRLSEIIDKSTFSKKQMDSLLTAIIDSRPDSAKLRELFGECELLAEAAGDEKTLAQLRFFRSDELDPTGMYEGLGRSMREQGDKRHTSNLRRVAKWIRGFLATIDTHGFKAAKTRMIPKKDYLRITGMSPSTFDRKRRSGEIKTNKRRGDPIQKPCLVIVPEDFGED